MKCPEEGGSCDCGRASSPSRLLPQRVRGPCKSETLGKKVEGGKKRRLCCESGKGWYCREVTTASARGDQACCWAFPLPGRRAEHFTDLSPSEEAILCNGLHILSVAFNKEALLVSNPFSGSAEPCSYLSELDLFSPPHAPCLHQCTLALTLSQPLEGDLFPVRKGDWERFQRP